MPEELEVLLHPGPLPAAIGHVLEAGFLHAGRSLDGVGEKRRVWKFAVAEAVVERHPQAADMGE